MAVKWTLASTEEKYEDSETEYTEDNGQTTVRNKILPHNLQ